MTTSCTPHETKTWGPAVDNARDRRRQQLDEWMDRRRLQIRRTWTQVAKDAGMGIANLNKIRRGVIGISWNAADGIERALSWIPGDIERAITTGEEPRPAPESVDERLDAESAALAEEFRQLFRRHRLSMTPRRLRKVLDHIDVALELERREMARRDAETPVTPDDGSYEDSDL